MNRNKIQELVTLNSSPSKADVEMERFYKNEIERLSQIITTKNGEIQKLEIDKLNMPKPDTKVFDLEKQRII